ncbi:pentapeptide repeat-containing protein [Moorena producens JHB]|uniref:Pentapeptide repeat-containing protein n=1 Tax=Moorena producens (strain JHB) TaxID=1454205 RepID=A0A1D9G927_MOOP1|nr:pentapeptide repeat-containing protein [Moorena producens]AOY84132.1 pentapeptide repeat-containing protein [Moorena producens JHB]
MKANEVLKKYAAGERDFRRENLRGQSFQGENLSGADFSEADIIGANFKNANLTGTKFCKANAGLQRRFVIFLLLCSWMITSGLSGMCSFFGGALVLLIVRSSGVAEQIDTWMVLIVIVVFFAVIIRQGIKEAVGLAVATVLGAALTLPFARLVAVALAVAGTLVVVEVVAVGGSFAMAEALGGSVALAIAVAGAEVGAVAGAEAAALTFDIGEALALALALAFLLLSMYLGWRALNDDPKNAWIRNLVIGFVATGGTSFYEANLTDADFTRAILNSTDLTKATLTRSCWQNTAKLDRAILGTSYLQDQNVRQLLITGEGQNQNFDRLDLRGINLKGANLQDASFIGTDLNRANLENANLSRAKLVQTLLEGADLTGATLTGAYIEDWGISNTTKLLEIDCDYIFLKLPTQNDPDPKRRPADQDRNFEPGEFAKLAQKIPNTVDLIFKDGIDWQTFLKTFQELRVESDTSHTEELPVIQTMENKGDGAFVIRVKVPDKVDEAEYERKFWAKYKPMLEAKDIEIKFLYEQIKDKRQENTELLGIVKTMADKETTRIDNIDMRNQSNAKFNIGANYVEKGEYVSSQESNAEQNNYEAPDKNLTEAAAEIQQLLEQLSQSNPTITEIEKLTVVARAAEEIKNNPTLKAKVINALKAGGVEAFKEAIDHPLVNILMATIERLIEA